MKMMVHRTRRTRDEWVRESDEVEVTAACVPRSSRTEAPTTAVLIGFEMASSGGGASRVVVSIPPQDFYFVLEAMLRVSEAATEDALAWARFALRDASEGETRDA